MSVGPVGGRGLTEGINALLSQLGSGGRVGPQGTSGGRPPVEGIEPFPSRPSFQQRYQQDSFEDSPRGRGGRGGGGGLDLTGRGNGSASGEGQQAGANQD